MAKAADKSVDPGMAGASAVAGGSSDTGSVPEQAKEKVQEGAVVVQEKAAELKTDAGEKVRQELQTRSTQAGAQLHSTAAAMRRSTEQLREDGNDGAAKAMEFVAERADRFGGYLTGVHADQMLRDVESFARRQPWLAALGGAAAGFFASRFLKASSTARYHGTIGPAGSREAWQPHPATPERPSLGAAAMRQQSSDQPVLTSQRGSSNG